LLKLVLSCICAFCISGSNEDLKLELELLTLAKPQKSRSKASEKKDERETEASKIDEVITSVDDNEQDETEEDIIDYKAAYEKSQERLKKYKSE